MLQFLWYLFIILVQVTLFIMHCQLKTIWVFLPTAVVSSNFQFSRKLCFQGAFSFYGERFAVRSDDTVWLGHCIHFSQCQSHSSCLHVFLKVFTLPSYIHQSHLPISCWKVAMVGLGNSVLCGKQGTWSWEGCFALPLLTPDPHSPEPGGAN